MNPTSINSASNKTELASRIVVRLKELRSRKEISQNELARRLSMSLANVQKIEYNKAKSIPLDTLDRLCAILECEVGDLLVRIPDGEVNQDILSQVQKLEVSSLHKGSTTKKTKRTRSRKGFEAA